MAPVDMAGSCPAHILEAHQQSTWVYAAAVFFFLLSMAMGIIIWWLNTALQKDTKSKSKPSSDDKEMSFAVENNMLTKKQVEEVVKRVNASVDIWGIPESVEEVIIRKYVEKTNGFMYPALRQFLDEHWVKGLKILLDEGKKPEAKTKEINKILCDHLQEPFATVLNEHVDFPFLGEGVEQRLLSGVVGKLLEALAEMAVGGIEQTGIA